MLFRIAEVSRAGYTSGIECEARKSRMDKDTELKEHILAIHHIRPYFGYNCMRTALRKEGIPLNHKKVRRLIRAKHTFRDS